MTLVQSTTQSYTSPFHFDNVSPTPLSSFIFLYLLNDLILPKFIKQREKTETNKPTIISYINTELPKNKHKKDILLGYEKDDSWTNSLHVADGSLNNITFRDINTHYLHHHHTERERGQRIIIKYRSFFFFHREGKSSSIWMVVASGWEGRCCCTSYV